jgi:hypothetical protein
MPLLSGRTARRALRSAIVVRLQIVAATGCFSRPKPTVRDSARRGLAYTFVTALAEFRMIATDDLR